MVTVHDVAAFILARAGQMTAMKLQKLCYYSQAWSLVWDERPLFGDRIEAWANGPVTPALYQAHRGEFLVGPGAIKGDPTALDAEQRETVEAVTDYYAPKYTAAQLSEITHREAPWRDAREGLELTERCNREITLAAMAEYYGAL